MSELQDANLRHLRIDGQTSEFVEGDSLLTAMMRAKQHPTAGGCLCHGGDCPHCLVTVDGVSYIRACQTKAKPGAIVSRDHLTGTPPLDLSTPAHKELHPRHVHCDVVVIGMGESGQVAAAEAKAAGKDVVTLDVHDGQEVIGIYAGPVVAARTDEGMLTVYPQEIVIATGAVEIQPVVDGNHLEGLYTVRAAETLVAAGIDLGKVVAIGNSPSGIDVQVLEGELIRFEGESTVNAVVVKNVSGTEERIECDSVCLGLGYQPRNGLARLANGLPNVTIVGDCAKQFDLPPCPTSGLVCRCSGVKAEDLNSIWEQGFQEMELLKRATLAGTGPCQGGMCVPHMRGFLLEKGKVLQDAFTSRPVNKQLTMGEISAGSQLHIVPKTALHHEHLKLGARMDRIGGWWRPWTYGNLLEEYWAVREAVSLGDVSTLGKMIISGPDALAFLEKLYPTQVSTIKTGRSRYVLLLNERGYVMDDGMVAKESDTRYFVTFTSGGSSAAEAWLRDWSANWNMDVRIMNVTNSLGAINVTGPLARELLNRAGLENLPKFIRHMEAEVAGVACKVFRLSFTGELSYELHHPAEDSVKLWRTLMELGKDLGVKPHGLEALEILRLEKGHILVGKDTDFDSTPRRIHHEWMVNLTKEGYIGHYAVTRTNKVPLDKKLVGLEMVAESFEDAVFDGSPIFYKNGDYAGVVTSSTYSPVLGKAVMLAWVWLLDGELPSDVVINSQTAKLSSTPFYDAEASRARA